MHVNVGNQTGQSSREVSTTWVAPSLQFVETNFDCAGECDVPRSFRNPTAEDQVGTTSAADSRNIVRRKGRESQYECVAKV